MKQQLEKIIDQLKDKRRICPACEALSKEHGYCECGAFLRNPSPNHPVWIGDVLAKLLPCLGSLVNPRQVSLDEAELVNCWRNCEITQSAQDIFFGQGVEWVEHEIYQGPDSAPVVDSWPKDPAKKALAELLIKLFKEKVDAT